MGSTLDGQSGGWLATFAYSTLNTVRWLVLEGVSVGHAGPAVA